MMFAVWLALAADLSEWRALPPVALRAELHHAQGIDLEGGVLWVSSVDAEARVGYVSRFELATGKLLAQVRVDEGARFHPGGLTLDGDSIWVPVGEYDRDGPTTVQRRDKRTLALLSSFTVHDHIGCLAADQDGLVGGNWDSRILYRWNRDGKELGKTPNPGKTRYQDLKIVGGALVGSGLLSKTEGAVDWLDPRDYRLVKSVSTGVTDRGVAYTQEGMTLRGGRLYLLPEDGPSRLFAFIAK
jgi:hypothetical protein